MLKNTFTLSNHKSTATCAHLRADLPEKERKKKYALNIQTMTRHTMCILVQEDTACMSMRPLMKISHQPAIHAHYTRELHYRCYSALRTAVSIHRFSILNKEYRCQRNYNSYLCDYKPEMVM